MDKPSKPDENKKPEKFDKVVAILADTPSITNKELVKQLRKKRGESMDQENKCYVCIAKGINTGDKLIEQHAPGFGVKGGMYLCETHNKEAEASLAKSE